MNEQLEQQGSQEQLEAPYTQHLFDVTREELHNMSKNQGKLMVIGELRASSLAEHWTGGISLRTRLDSGEITHDEITEATERLTEYFVPVKIGAPKRCVDGRTKKGYVDTDPEPTMHKVLVHRCKAVLREMLLALVLQRAMNLM